MAYQVNIAFEESDRLTGTFEGSFKPHTPPSEFLAHVSLGRKVPDHLMAHAPKRFVVPDELDGTRDFRMVQGCWVVTDRFVELVQALEPGVHQFIQLDSICASGAPTRRQYYLMNVLVRFSALIVAESSVRRKLVGKPGQQSEVLRHTAMGKSRRYVLLKDPIRGHHLWKGGEGDLFGAVYFSDALMNAVRTGGLSPLDAIYAEERLARSRQSTHFPG